MAKARVTLLVLIPVTMILAFTVLVFAIRHAAKYGAAAEAEIAVERQGQK